MVGRVCVTTVEAGHNNPDTDCCMQSTMELLPYLTEYCGSRTLFLRFCELFVASLIVITHIELRANWNIFSPKVLSQCLSQNKRNNEDINNMLKDLCKASAYMIVGADWASPISTVYFVKKSGLELSVQEVKPQFTGGMFRQLGNCSFTLIAFQVIQSSQSDYLG